jgi:hypothetical protein
MRQNPGATKALAEGSSEMQEELLAIRKFAPIPQSGVDPILEALDAKLRLFASLLREHGADAEIDSAAARLAWAGLPEPAKLATFRGFSHYVQNCEDLTSAGISLRDNYSFLMHTMKRAGLFTQENIQSFLTNQNIVEVYDLNHIQIFRTINFFDLCNYSLLDLLAREWFVLYERLSSVSELSMREFQLCLASGKLRRLTIPVHLLKERDSNPRGVFRFDFQFCCPLYSAPDVCGGYLLTENVTELELYAPGEETKISFIK